MVPRDPKNPSLGTIGMAIDRHRATGSAGERIGSLLVNPGGPGESGVDALPGIVSGMPSDVLEHFDVVGFDPPGVGRTAPITCLSSAGLSQYFDENPAPTTSAGFDALVADARTFAAGCEKQSGAELPYVSTVDAAMDMDVLRQGAGGPEAELLRPLLRDLPGCHLRPAVSDPREGHGSGRGARPGRSGPEPDR